MIERRLENLLALDYPADRVEIVVASDASSDRTNELVEAVAADEPRVRLLDCPRGGKVAAQDRAVRETAATSSRSPTRTRAGRRTRSASSSRRSPTRRSRYVCGRLQLEDAEGANREGLYWRYELWLREQESRLGSITGGNGSIYALRRDAYVEVDPRWGHDLALPVPDGAGRPSRGLRARGAGVRAADADERDGVRAQGADVRALLGDHAARLDAPPAAARVPRRDALAPRAALRERRAPPRPRSRRASCSRRPAGRTRSSSLGQLALLAAFAARVPHRALLRLRDVGDRPGALATTCGAASRPPGIPRRRGEPRSPTSRSRGSASCSRARCSPRPRSRSSSRTAGRCSTGRRASARTARDFEVLKLRSMVVGAEHRGRRLRRRPRRRADHAGRAGSSGGRRSTSCRSSGTSSAATCP